MLQQCGILVVPVLNFYQKLTIASDLIVLFGTSTSEIILRPMFLSSRFRICGHHRFADVSKLWSSLWYLGKDTPVVCVFSRQISKTKKTEN